MIPAIIRVIAIGLSITSAQGQGLKAAFEAAQIHDPVFRSAKAEYLASQQLIPLARAALLPNVGITWSETRVTGSLASDTLPGRELDYRAPVRNLTLRMPVYSRELFLKTEIADIQVEYAERYFSLKRADLLERLVGIWLQSLLAREGIAFANFAVVNAEIQSAHANKAYALGDGSKTDAEEADAMLILARSQLLESQNQQIQSDLTWKQMVGTDFPLPAGQTISIGNRTQSTTELCHLQGTSLDAILAKAASNSASIEMRRLAIEISKKALARNEAGHFPKVDFVANAQSSRNESLGTLNQSVDQQSISVQLSLPLYSGGYVSASVKQAAFDLEKSLTELESEQQNVARTVRRLYYSCIDNTHTVQAQQRIHMARKSIQEGLKKARLAGLASQIELIAGEFKVRQAQLDWIKALRDHASAALQLTTRTGAEPSPLLEQLDLLLQD